MTSATHCTQTENHRELLMRIELVPLGVHWGTNIVPSGTSPDCATVSSEACAIMNSLFLCPMEVTKDSQIL
jgi:hypothetical protein